MTTFGMVMSLLRLSTPEDSDAKQAKMLQVTRKGFQMLCDGDTEVSEKQVKAICETYGITKLRYDMMTKAMDGDSDIWIANLPSTPAASAVRPIILSGVNPQEISTTINISIAYLWAMCIGLKPEIADFYDRLNKTYHVQIDEDSNCIIATDCTLQQRALLWMIGRSINYLRKDSMRELLAMIESASSKNSPEWKSIRRTPSPVKLFLQSRSGMSLTALSDRLSEENFELGDTFRKFRMNMKPHVFTESDLSAISKFLDLSLIDTIFFDYCNKLSEDSFCIPVSAATITVQQKQLIELLQNRILLLDNEACENIFRLLTRVFTTSVGDVQGRRIIRCRADDEKGGAVGMFLRNVFGRKMPTVERLAKMMNSHTSSAGRILRGEADVTYEMFMSLSKSCCCDELDHELLRYSCYINRRRLRMDMYGTNIQQKLIGEQFQSVILELTPDEIEKIRKVLDGAEARRFHRAQQIT